MTCTHSCADARIENRFLHQEIHRQTEGRTGMQAEDCTVIQSCHTTATILLRSTPQQQHSGRKGVRINFLQENGLYSHLRSEGSHRHTIVVLSPEKAENADSQFNGPVFSSTSTIRRKLNLNPGKREYKLQQWIMHVWSHVTEKGMELREKEKKGSNINIRLHPVSTHFNQQKPQSSKQKTSCNFLL